MKTMQGVRTRRHDIAGLLMGFAAFTVAFCALVLVARELIWPPLSSVIADVTSVWVEVPEESADLYRMLGYQEGSRSNGMPQFRDLSDYRAIADFIQGPVVWGAYAAGIAAVAVWWTGRCAHAVDEVTYAVACVADGDAAAELPPGLADVQREFARLRERAQADARAVQAAEARKNELVAYLAHDIKTPLTSVIGYLSLLAEEPGLSSARRERYARAAFEKAERLDAMMDEFFEITRYNLGAIPIERVQTDVRTLLEQLVDEFYPVAQARDVTIELDVPDGFTAFIDPEKMARVLGNLMKNGLAYADAGSTLVCRAHAEGERAAFAVEDTGREISPVHLKSIFEKFYRADGARSGGGAGLGLAIAKEIVEAHGGSIEASSTEGVTTFTVRD